MTALVLYMASPHFPTSCNTQFNNAVTILCVYRESCVLSKSRSLRPPQEHLGAWNSGDSFGRAATWRAARGESQDRARCATMAAALRACMRCCPKIPHECDECQGSGVCAHCKGGGTITLVGPKGEDLRPPVWSYAMDKKGRWEPAKDKMQPKVAPCRRCGGVGGFEDFRGSLASVSPSVPKVPKDEHKGDGKCRKCRGTGQVYAHARVTLPPALAPTGPRPSRSIATTPRGT